MVMYEEKGVNKKKKNRLKRTVQPVAPIPQVNIDLISIQNHNNPIPHSLKMLKFFLSGYLIGSALFFTFPKILHKTKKFAHTAFQQVIDRKRILNICHRGSPKILAQNTIESFEEGAKRGDMLEMDVCSTRDGVLVVHHDLSLARACGVQKLVSQVDYQDLPILRSKIELHFAPQGTKITTNGQKIPTLEQVFAKFPGMPMNIELKTPTQEAIIKFTKLLIKYNRENTTFVGIRSNQAQKLNLYCPSALRFCSDREVSKIILVYFLGMLPFMPIRAQVFQIPLFTTDFYQWKKRQWKNPLKTYAFFGILRAMNYLMIPLTWHLRQRGIMTYYWVCNNQQEFDRAIACGASGIITDQPARLSSYLSSKGQ